MSEIGTLAPALTLLIGILLGMLGGGGSILVVPVLLYLAGLEEKLSMVVSLIVVGVASLVAAWPHNRAGQMALRTGILFAIGSSVGAFGGAQVQPMIHSTVVQILFSCAMLVAAAFMLSPNRTTPDTPTPVRPFWIILLQGAAVGVVIGTVGVGGGMAVVPALVLMGRLSIKRAIGTSLLVIGLNSASAFAGYFVQRGVLVQLETTMVGSIPLFPYILLLVATTAGGALIGTSLAQRLEPANLQRAFGILLVGVALFLLVQNVAWL